MSRFQAVRLRTQWLENPLGVDVAAPRLSWELTGGARGSVQSAWQVLVASSEAALVAAQQSAEGQSLPAATGLASVTGLVAAKSSAAAAEGVLWDSGRREGAQSLGVVYGGAALGSSQQVYWAVRVWDQHGKAQGWSRAASWSMGLLGEADWQAQWISHRDESPLHKDRDSLSLPPAAFYRKDFSVASAASAGEATGGSAARVERAVFYLSALGLCEAWLNGQRVGDGWLEPGWSDYRRRAYYRTHDVTALLAQGAEQGGGQGNAPGCGQAPDALNTLGIVVADGWYAGYLGFCLFVGYGPYRNGRNLYGKTPAVRAQLEIFYSDGSVRRIGTDESWQVSTGGPIREADILMGEAYDARLENVQWCTPARSKCSGEGSQAAGNADRGVAARGGADCSGALWDWQAAVPAAANGSVPAVFYDTMGPRDVDLGFAAPLRMQSYMAPPIRVTQELPVRSVREQAEQTWIFDLAQNFAGVIRLRVRGAAGTRLRLRYAEQLHPDGSVMTENLRRARATDFYTLRGDDAGEQWTPRFTYHGFQYVELTVLEGGIDAPDASAVTGLVLHSDTPLVGTFECSDPVLTRFGQNALWTQRANFVEVPTDCPQRDERLGWTGDALAYIRTASFNADIAAFFTKWMDDVEEAQLDSGAYPDYCPFPMSHGKPYTTAWTDAGVVCPWTLWKVYGDTAVVAKHWASMERFMDWRFATCTRAGTGLRTGNDYGDWLNVDEPTSIEFLDTCYHALCCSLMLQMAQAQGLATAAEKYASRLAVVTGGFRRAYIDAQGRLTEDSQTAHVLALWLELVPAELAAQTASALVAKIRAAGVAMTTGFLGSRLLLPVLSDHGYHDLATQLFQRREFPSWGYEVVNGATSVWERWDSFTTEYGFSGRKGDQNASMNSFSHYTFGAVMEWAFRYLAGIDTLDEGYGEILIRPLVPAAGSGLSGVEPVSWVRASYRSVRGRIASAWKREGGVLTLDIEIPVGSVAKVVLPQCAASGSAPVPVFASASTSVSASQLAESLQVDGQPLALAAAAGVERLENEAGLALRVPSGKWTFSLPWED